MINNYKKITNKYLKANKKRTILTVVGIVLSVALIATIGLFFKGIQEAEIDAAIRDNGSFHLGISALDQDIISKVKNNPSVLKSGIISQGKFIEFSDNQGATKIIASGDGLELLPYRATEGRLPEDKDEVAIESWVLKYIDPNTKLNDKIKIENKEYILVGLLENSVVNQGSNSGIILLKDDNLDLTDATLLVEIKSRANLKKSLKAIESLVPKDKYIENSQLLMLQGAGDGDYLKSIYVILFIIIGIVVLATIAVIYNSFQISVVERIKQFGLLRAIGATPKQIRKIVLKEASILIMIGVPIGLLCGVFANFCVNIAFKILIDDSGEIIKFVISPEVLIISALVATISIYISAYIPAKHAGSISPLVAISSRNSITKEKIRKNKSRLIKILFGFEGDLASKNIKRNRKRYRVTVFSITISVVLFITFKSFTDMSLNISSTINESNNIHFSVINATNNTDTEFFIKDDIIDNIKNISSVKEVYKKYNPSYFKAVINKENEVSEVKNMDSVYKDVEYQGKSMDLLYASLVAYDEPSMEIAKKYLDSGDINIENINSEDGVILINKNQLYNNETENSYIGPIANINVGDEINIQLRSFDNIDDEGNLIDGFGQDEKNQVKKVKVLAILKDEPFNYNGYSNGLKLITTKEVLENITNNKIKANALNIKINNVEDEKKTLDKLDEIIKNENSLKIINQIDQNRKNKSSTLMVQILLYGFVIVISLISTVNIINTLTTNIILRRREFATLKAIGLTQKGLKKMIVLEGLLYGIVGSVIGSIIGSGLSYLLFRNMYNIREMGWSIPWDAILIAVLFSLIIGYLSVLSPLARVKKDNLIDTIREE
ncbi:MAG: FtsX-like permease family protein [Clostridiaceae bacterium]